MFKTGSPVKGKDFIDRKQHLPIFKAYLDNSQHVMIKAPRRFGKTSMVKHVFEYERHAPHIYLDVRRATSLESLANQVLDKAYEFAGINNFLRTFKRSAIDLFKSVQSVKIDDIGEITLKMLEGDINETELFLHSLDTVDRIAIQKDLSIKFVFDEFQDIAKIADKNILNQMRSVMQHHERTTYVFLGSIESMMTDIFESKSSPFFHFARVMQLEGLDIDELLEYTYEILKQLDVSFDDSVERLLRFLNGHPDYSAQTLQNLYYRIVIDKPDMIDDRLCKEIVSGVIMENKAYLEELISKAKSRKHHYEVLDALANDREVDISSKSLYIVNTSLEDMGLIRNTGRGKYEITDIFLRVLLRQPNDEDFALRQLIKIDI